MDQQIEKSSFTALNIYIWLLQTLSPAAHKTNKIKAEFTFTYSWKYFKIIINMCDSILFYLWAQSCILNAISIETECQVLPSCNFTVYVKIPWQHSGKLNLKLNFKPLHATIIFQATISRKGKQKTDGAYTIVQNRFLMSNGTVFPFFSIKELFQIFCWIHFHA